MTNFTAVIVDDEPYGRELLAGILRDFFPHIKLLGMANDADSAFELIENCRPDLILLDIEMPKGSGFDLLQKWKEGPEAEVVFVTAFDHYAIQAFKANAIDYVLKPVSVTDLGAALEKVERRLAKAETAISQQGIQALLRKVYEGAEQKMVALPLKDGVEYVAPAAIVRCEADGRYSIVHLDDGKKRLVSKSLGELAAILPQNLFFRIHNSHLINLRNVRKYLRTDGGRVYLSDGSSVEVARSRREEFLKAME